MADLLVTSMMADGGLEAAFEASLQGEEKFLVETRCLLIKIIRLLFVLS